MALFGYAINQDVREVPTAVLDRSRSAEVSLLFIAANLTLTLGLVNSSLVTNQLQATQAAFFFLPSVLLSGFMFLFESMPEPAQ